MNGVTIIRGAIPDASEDLCEHIIWERTPYPFGPVTPQELYRTAHRLRRASANGIRLCELCDNRVEPGRRWTCARCDHAMERAREALV